MIQTLWKWARSTGVARYLLLMAFPLFGRPLHFVAGDSRRSYASARFGVVALPLAAAGLWVLAMTLFFDGVAIELLPRLNASLGEVAAYRRMTLLNNIVKWETLLLILGGVLALSHLRYAYFRLARKAVVRFGRPGLQVPLVPRKYFLVSTSSTALLYGIAGVLFGLVQRYGVEHHALIQSVAASSWFAALLLAFGGASWIGWRNRQAAHLELYGSAKASRWVDLAVIPLLLVPLLLVGLLI